VPGAVVSEIKLPAASSNLNVTFTIPLAVPPASASTMKCAPLGATSSNSMSSGRA